MFVHVKLFSRLREHLPSAKRGAGCIELPDGATVADLLAQLGIEARVKLITVNGARVDDRQQALDDGDTVRVFPFAVGG